MIFRGPIPRLSSSSFCRLRYTLKALIVAATPPYEFNYHEPLNLLGWLNRRVLLQKKEG
jgi:hypothetical protein